MLRKLHQLRSIPGPDLSYSNSLKRMLSVGGSLLLEVQVEARDRAEGGRGAAAAGATHTRALL